MKPYINGFEVDNDKLVENLHELADGIDSGDVAVQGGAQGEEIGIEEPSEFTVEVKFVATDEEYAEVFEYGDNK